MQQSNNFNPNFVYKSKRRGLEICVSDLPDYSTEYLEGLRQATIEDIAQIKASMDRATILKEAGTPIEFLQYKKMETARRFAGAFVCALNQEMRNRNAKQKAANIARHDHESKSFERAFIGMAAKMLPKKAFQQIADAANAKVTMLETLKDLDVELEGK